MSNVASTLGNFDATDIEIRYLTMNHCYIVGVLDGKLLITNDLENGRGIQVTYNMYEEEKLFINVTATSNNKKASDISD